MTSIDFRRDPIRPHGQSERSEYLPITGVEIHCELSIIRFAPSARLRNIVHIYLPIVDYNIFIIYSRANLNLEINIKNPRIFIIRQSAVTNIQNTFLFYSRVNIIIIKLLLVVCSSTAVGANPFGANYADDLFAGIEIDIRRARLRWLWTEAEGPIGEHERDGVKEGDDGEGCAAGKILNSFRIS